MSEENVLELKYEDYVEKADVNPEEESPNGVSRLYRMLDGYNKMINNGSPQMLINIGYSPDFGYYTYSKVNEEDYQLMKLGKDINIAFLKLVIYNIEFSNAVKEEGKNREQVVSVFAKKFNDMDYSSCLFYAEYIMNKLKTYYGEIFPQCVVTYFENYLLKTTGNIWKYNGYAFYPVRKEESGMKRKRELGNN